MKAENISLVFAHKQALQTFTAGLNAMFLLSFDNIDYLVYYNFRRFYTQAVAKLQNEQFNFKKKKKITIPVELNVYSSLCKLMAMNEDYLKHDDSSYLNVIALDIVEQGRQLLMVKQAVFNAETQKGL